MKRTIFILTLFSVKRRILLKLMGVLLLSIFLFGCNQKKPAESQTVFSPGAQTQTDAEPSLQPLTEDLSTFVENESEKNNNNDLFDFVHTEDNPIKIWGWSKDGIVGVSELKDTGNRGGTAISAFVLNVVSDTVLWERTIDSFNFDDYSTIPENEIKAFFNNFHTICRQQFGINIQEGGLFASPNTAFRHNEKIFNVIIDADIEIDNWIREYSVIVETDDRRKTIFSTDSFLPFLPVFYRYSISPFEERALIIVRWNSLSHSYGFIYAGCHLSAGFR